MIEVCDRKVEGGERDRAADVIFKQAVLGLGNNGNTLARLATPALIDGRSRLLHDHTAGTSRGCSVTFSIARQ